jgi:hypothetical protein
MPNSEVYMIGSRGFTHFEIIGRELFTGDTLKIENFDPRMRNYLWKFPDGANLTQSNEFEPANITFSTEGLKTIKLYVENAIGCIDTAYETIEVFRKTQELQNQEICNNNSSGFNFQDSLEDRKYFVARSMIEDKYGNHIIVGGYSDLIYQTYSRGAEDMFIAKFDKTGKRLWMNSTYSPVGAGDENIIAEDVYTDTLGYTYILGSYYRRTSFYFAEKDTSLSTAPSGLFFLKFSPSGRILWIKYFHNDNNNFYTKGSFIKGGNNDFYILANRTKGYSFHMNNQLFADNFSNESGIMIHLNDDGVILRHRTFPEIEKNISNISQNGNYSDLPKPLWSKSGLLAFTLQLDVDLITTGKIDDAIINFNTSEIKSALIFFDTTEFRFKKILPLYHLSEGLQKTIFPTSFALDESENFYISYTAYVNRPYTPSPIYYDTVKMKDYISSYSREGNLRWLKQFEGFHPSSLFIQNNVLLSTGRNYAVYVPGISDGSFFIPGYTFPKYSLQTQTFDSLKKITFVSDINSFIGQGTKGLGSVDLMFVKLNSFTGEPITITPFGTPLEDESAILSKGYGNQMWLTGTVGGNFLDTELNSNTDTSSKLYTYKIPIENDCNIVYEQQSQFVNLDIIVNADLCYDSLMTISWSSFGTGNINLYHKKPGDISFTLLASEIHSALEFYQFNPLEHSISGATIFKIESVDKSIADTIFCHVSKKTLPSVTVTASAINFCRKTTVTFTASGTNAGSNPQYHWFVNDQDQYLPGNTFTTSELTDQSNVKAVLISNAPCQSQNWALSNTITVSVTPNPTPAINISGTTTLLTGQSTLILSNITNGGTLPTYRWEDSTNTHTWKNIIGETNSTINYTPQYMGDKLRARLTSNQDCVIPVSVNSNVLTFIVNNPTSLPDNLNGLGNIKIWPNPAQNVLTIANLKLIDSWESIEIITIDGKRILFNNSIKMEDRIDLNISHLKNGLYILKFRKKNGREHFYKFEKIN